MVKRNLKAFGAILLAVMMMFACLSALTACKEDPFSGLLDPDDPTTIMVWNYYNDTQSVAFNELISEFNSTVGSEKGIKVTQSGAKNINLLADKVLDSVDKKSGADPIPDLVAVYSETAFILEGKDALVGMDDYFNKEDLDKYVPSFIEEGRFRENGELYLMPISKSTEVVAYNATDWAPFEAATGVTIDSIKTIEDMVSAAKKYYAWSGGKALYGRDSLENYVYSSTTQLGHEMFKVDSDGKVTVDIDKGTFEKMWDNYYVPMVNGYFYGTKNIESDKSTYASDLAYLGNILALTCSTSAMTYFPNKVMESDKESHQITAVVKKPLKFDDEVRETYIQQGAAYCMLKTTPARQYASSLFLKWITQKEHSLQLSILSSYCPVTKDANNPETIKEAYAEFSKELDATKSENILKSLTVSSEALSSGKTYVCKPFDGAKEVRAYLGDAIENTTIRDCRKIEKAMEGGASRAEAMSANATDFDTWFDGVVRDVNKLLGK